MFETYNVEFDGAKDESLVVVGGGGGGGVGFQIWIV